MKGNMERLLWDTHCHLSFPPLFDRIEAVLDRAARAGVKGYIVPAYDRASWADLAVLAETAEIHTALGLHPWVADEDLSADQLSAEIKSQSAVAIGEIGLDFKLEKFDRERQMEVFRLQLDLALELDLPVLLHCRGAFEEMLDILKDYAPRLRGVLHAYSRGPQLAQRFLDLGLYLAFGGAITRPRAKQARRTAITTPLDRILLETDAPSIGLDGVAPEDVEPQHVSVIARTLAELRDLNVDEIMESTTENVQRLFNIT